MPIQNIESLQLVFMTPDKLVDEAHKQVFNLLNLELPSQRTPEWFKARTGCITASDIANALPMSKDVCEFYVNEFGIDKFKYSDTKPCNKYGTLKQLIIKKVHQDAKHTVRGPEDVISCYDAIWHGQMFEPIAQVIYSQKLQEDLAELGLVQHPTIPFLAASPDGIALTSGRMLEIKCPSSRQVSSVPPLWYWLQMQTQLECCGLQVCDFMDCQFARYKFEEEWLEDATKWWASNQTALHHEYGLFLVDPEVGKDNHEARYYYAPASVLTIDDFQSWAKKTQERLICEDGVHTEVFYYCLYDHHLVTVNKQPDWTDKIVPIIKDVWDKVLHFRSEEGKDDFQAWLKQGTRTRSAFPISLSSPDEQTNRASKTESPDAFWKTCYC